MEAVEEVTEGNNQGREEGKRRNFGGGKRRLRKENLKGGGELNMRVDNNEISEAERTVDHVTLMRLFIFF